MWNTSRLLQALSVAQEVLQYNHGFGATKPAGGCSSHPVVEISADWKILGPFQIGTREAPWGADPSMTEGCSTHSNKTCRSSLTKNGTIQWENIVAKSVFTGDYSTQLHLTFDSPEIDWLGLRLVYGWAALQYQARALGRIVVYGEKSQTIALHTESVLEYRIDEQTYFGGDFYNYRRAPNVVRLSPGQHEFDIRLIRDVRSMGGADEPSIAIRVDLETLRDDLHADVANALLPDSLHGLLANSYGSIPLRNYAECSIKILRVFGKHYELELLGQAIEILPGQTRPISFSIASTADSSGSLELEILYGITSTSESKIISVACAIKSRSIDEVRTITYVHPAGVISSALLRPPLGHHRDESSRPTTQDTAVVSLPIMINLHGAGVDPNGDDLRKTFDGIEDLPAWVLIPSGVTSWSGDDWHQWGWADVEEAVKAIPKWIESTSWTGPSANLQRWLVTGHSNGGQGVWYALTHKPKRIFAAVVASGYSSISNYVPYKFWQETSPYRAAVLQAAMNSYKHELLIVNGKEIPTFIQHGSVDDNVPPYHSRRMHQLLGETGGISTYAEIADAGHWFEGVLTTDSLRAFYKAQLSKDLQAFDIPKAFKLVVANPAEQGMKYCVQVDQLVIPGLLGTVAVSIGKMVKIETSNVRRLSFSKSGLNDSDIEVDGQVFRDSQLEQVTHLMKDGLIPWKIAALATPLHSAERHGDQQGHLDSILRSRGTFSIVNHSHASSAIALQISRNLFQYFAADSAISGPSRHTHRGNGNVISIGLGSVIPECHAVDFPIRTDDEGLWLRDSTGASKRFNGAGLGAIFLRPFAVDRLELVVWGVDMEGLNGAARLVPTLTGVGVGDFVVLNSRDAAVRGVNGAVALGFFDFLWNVSSTSFVV